MTNADTAAALVLAHAEAHRLITKLTEQINAVDPDNANWGHVGDINNYVEKLREMTGENG